MDKDTTEQLLQAKFCYGLLDQQTHSFCPEENSRQCLTPVCASLSGNSETHDYLLDTQNPPWKADYVEQFLDTTGQSLNGGLAWQGRRVGGLQYCMSV